MAKRVFNFNPGPAVLPLEVLETLKDNLVDFGGTGMGILEISHRGKEFQAVIDETQRSSILLIEDHTRCCIRPAAPESVFDGADELADPSVPDSASQMWAQNA